MASETPPAGGPEAGTKASASNSAPAPGPGAGRPLRATRKRAGRGLRLPTRFHKPKPGSPSGIEAEDITRIFQPATTQTGPARITCIDYGPDRCEAKQITDFDAFLSSHRPEWAAVRWINVDGLSDLKVIQGLATKYSLHPLAIEDVLHVGQRPKVEPYGSQGYAPESEQCLAKDPNARLFIVVRMLELRGVESERHLYSEQISMFLGHNTLLTIQESPGDIWDPIRTRIQTKGSRLRLNGAAFLTYSLIDAIIDYCFPVLEYYGDRLEELEDLILDRPSKQTINQIHQLKRELLLLRRAVWPMREVVHTLQREPHECMDNLTRTYLRDVYDHTVQIIDIIETYREFASGLTETYMSSLSNRMNEIVKVLTIISTIFIPLTFLAGVYGMNFTEFPELHWKYGYATFWGACILIAGVMVVWFKRRRWLE